MFCQEEKVQHSIKYWWYLFLQLATSYEVEFWARELFIIEFIIVKMRAEDDNVVRKTTLAAEYHINSLLTRQQHSITTIPEACTKRSVNLIVDHYSIKTYLRLNCIMESVLLW